MRAWAVAVAFVALSAPASADERLLRAYPDQLKEIAGNEIVWRDGTRMTIDDGRSGKTDEQALVSASPADIFRNPYRKGAPSGPPTADPGRYRPAAFFEKMYGRCGSAGFAAGFGRVNWLPRHGGGTVMVTRINGVDRRLQAVSDELDALPEALIGYLKPNSGTFNCRKIAGTEQASAHGYGIAIDINAAFSDYWRWSKTGYRNRIPQPIVDLFERHGFIWGGKWMHFDTMHFEYRPELLL